MSLELLLALFALLCTFTALVFTLFALRNARYTARRSAPESATTVTAASWTVTHLRPRTGRAMGHYHVGGPAGIPDTTAEPETVGVPDTIGVPERWS